MFFLQYKEYEQTTNKLQPTILYVMASRSTGWMNYNDYKRQKEKDAMSIIYAYGETRGVTMKRISLQELKHDLAWVYDLFPEDDNELDTYLENGDAKEIKVKYVMFNSFMEQRDKEHRIFVYNKVLLSLIHI